MDMVSWAGVGGQIASMSFKPRSAQTSKGTMVQVKWLVLAQIYHNGVLDQGGRTVRLGCECWYVGNRMQGKVHHPSRPRGEYKGSLNTSSN